MYLILDWIHNGKIMGKKNPSIYCLPESNAITVLLAVGFKVQYQTGHCNWITLVPLLVTCISAGHMLSDRGLGSLQGSSTHLSSLLNPH